MAWFDRLFPHHNDTAPAEAAPTSSDGTSAEIPPERRGINGEYDQSGLAKRVVAAFDEQGVEDAPHLYVAQHDTTIVFKGSIHSADIVSRLTEIAKGVDGTTDVDSSAVKVA